MFPAPLKTKKRNYPAPSGGGGRGIPSGKFFRRYSSAERKKFFQRLPRALAKYAFLTFLTFLFLSLIFGGLTFYKYGVLSKKAEPEVEKKPLPFEEKVYQRILNEQESRKKRFEEADSKEYPDPFKEIYPQGTEKQSPSP